MLFLNATSLAFIFEKVQRPAENIPGRICNFNLERTDCDSSFYVRKDVRLGNNRSLVSLSVCKAPATVILSPVLG